MVVQASGPLEWLTIADTAPDAHEQWLLQGKGSCLQKEGNVD